MRRGSLDTALGLSDVVDASDADLFGFAPEDLHPGGAGVHIEVVVGQQGVGALAVK